MPRSNTRQAPSPVTLLVAGLEEAFHRRSWHGPNLMGALRGITTAVATWRPAPGRHNIWELIVHAAYWKYTVTRQLTGAKRGGFALEGSNWFRRDGGSPSELRADLLILKRAHTALVDAVRVLPPSDLSKPSPKRTWTYTQLIRGVAAHDLYHAGQVQLLKRLQSAP